MTNLYLVERRDGVDYDQYISIIAAADNEEDATKVRPDGPAEDEYDLKLWPSRFGLKATFIGVAADNIPAGICLHSDLLRG